ncbi:MAG: formate dehydrogenase subunit alpha [Anaerolineae bacterium]
MEYRNVLTTCVYCGAGCGLYVQVLDGRAVGVLPAWQHPVSEGKLCIKGWNSTAFVHHPDRLTQPLVKRGGVFQPASWDEALDLVVRRLTEIREAHGPDALGFLCSAKCTNEENYLLQKWARAVVGTHNVDHCARLCHSPTVAGLATTFGSGAMTNSIPELEGADCILVTGSNTTEGHPLIATRIYRAVERGAKLIVVDPRDIQLARFATLHLRQRPGTDVAWLNGMMHVIIQEGLLDEAFVRERTEGFEALKEAVATYTPERVEEITGIPAGDLMTAARMYAQAEKASIVYAMGITQHTTGTDNVISCANLAMLTGNVGKESTGVNPLRGQNNVQGACDVGGLPNVYPGYQAVTDEAVREKFQKAWGSAPPLKVGLTLTEMTGAIEEGRLRGMFILGENPVLSDPDAHHVRHALEQLDFLAVQDIFLTETAELADVVLAGVSFAEKDGTLTATDRRIQRVRRAIEPLAGSRPDWAILCDLARRFGMAGFDFASPAEVMEEIAALTPIYGGVNYARLEKAGFLQWPCPSPNHPGTPYLHEGKFPRGLGRFVPREFQEPAELPDKEYPFLLTTGRSMFHWHTGSMTRRSEKLEQEVPEAYVELNPEDATRLGVRKSGRVRIRSRRGEIETKVWITKRVPRGVVFVPFHFAEAAANVLTNAAYDPVAKIPEYKVCAVRVEPAGEPGR